MNDITILRRLAQIIESRKSAETDSSYVAKLFHGGQDKILKKIAEESAETIMASKDGNTDQIIYETADLWFHCLILLAFHELSPDDVLKELERREGVSGIQEKASRTSD
ncbi:phosphoribosyl-ATP pyrophosphatase [Nitrosomonas ureae]|jgi:phosphoribosyl-ATP pyrophosphohydrolase|uniref:Phosphoribosyl-ATP pyrophosphatase n=1 Tax=Nitrosomonas ureae TaxID=44577 RepID=A0A285BYK1_9PROT|nr:phosphoribosyl-ATP diphosphatase [Nitrosomonas ureae]SNX59948.1 phosphoribosyl-ATP pyrophosphatase [Nitrosomonas ureae]